jgi:hypothetical protein
MKSVGRKLSVASVEKLPVNLLLYRYCSAIVETGRILGQKTRTVMEIYNETIAGLKSEKDIEAKVKGYRAKRYLPQVSNSEERSSHIRNRRAI